jgi:hypothetical protein
VGRRIDIEADNLLELVGKGLVVGELVLADALRLEPMARQMRCTELTLMPVDLAMAAAVQWVASPGGSALVKATTRSMTAKAGYLAIDRLQVGGDA